MNVTYLFNDSDDLPMYLSLATSLAIGPCASSTPVAVTLSSWHLCVCREEDVPFPRGYTVDGMCWTGTGICSAMQGLSTST